MVFDILFAEGKGAEDESALDEIVRNAVRDTLAPQAPRAELKAGNLTVSYGLTVSDGARNPSRRSNAVSAYETCQVAR